MDELLNQLLGSKTLPIWGAGLMWVLIAEFIIKLYYYDDTKKFNLIFWLNDNIKDLALGFLLSMTFLRLGDWGIYLAEKYTDLELNNTEDFVAIMILVSGYIQYRLHKRRKSLFKKIEEKMKISNELNKGK